MKKQRFTDVGNALRLAARFKKEIKYVPSWGWFRWTGTRWSRDKTGHVERCAKQIIEDMFVRAEQLKNKKLAQALKKHAKRCEANARIKAMIGLAKTESSLVATPEQFDRDQWLFNCSNGTLNLRTGYLRKHRSRDFLTRLSPVEYDASAECPRWLSFLDRIMKGDEELIEFLQRAIGYSLTGDTGAQCFFILFGAGANGKTTFLEVIRRLFGDYGRQTPSDTLMLKRPGAIPNDLARLRGVRFVTATETEANRHLGEEQVKQLTGSDIVVARFLHREFFEYRPAFKIFLATNHLLSSFQPSRAEIDPLPPALADVFLPTRPRRFFATGATFFVLFFFLAFFFGATRPLPASAASVELPAPRGERDDFFVAFLAVFAFFFFATVIFSLPSIKSLILP